MIKSRKPRNRAKTLHQAKISPHGPDCPSLPRAQNLVPRAGWTTRQGHITPTHSRERCTNCTSKKSKAPDQCASCTPDACPALLQLTHFLHLSPSPRNQRDIQVPAFGGCRQDLPNHINYVCLFIAFTAHLKFQTFTLIVGEVDQQTLGPLELH